MTFHSLKAQALAALCASLAITGCSSQAPNSQSLIPDSRNVGNVQASDASVRRIAPKALPTSDFQWVTGDSVVAGKESVAQCPTGWTMIAGGSYYSQDDPGHEGQGGPDFADQAWTVNVPNQQGTTGRAYASCVAPAIAKDFQWVESSNLPLYNGYYGAVCPSGYSEISGAGNGKQWAVWNGEPANIYFSVGYPDWVSCGSNSVMTTKEQTATNSPQSLLTGCDSGSIVIGGTMGDFDNQGPARMMYPNLAAHNPPQAFWTYSSDAEIVNWVGCAPVS